MQTGSGRRHRPGILGIYGLVRFAIARLCCALQIGWKWYGAMGVQPTQKFLLGAGRKFDIKLAIVFGAATNGPLPAAGEKQAGARIGHVAPRAGQAAPARGLFGILRQKQNFKFSPRGVFAEKAGFQNLCFIEHQNITRAEQVANLVKLAVSEFGGMAARAEQRALITG